MACNLSKILELMLICILTLLKVGLEFWQAWWPFWYCLKLHERNLKVYESDEWKVCEWKFYEWKVCGWKVYKQQLKWKVCEWKVYGWKVYE